LATAGVRDGLSRRPYRGGSLGAEHGVNASGNGSWFNNLETYGGGVDVPTAQWWVQEAHVGYEALADDVIRLLDTDKIALAIERVADALIDRGTLLPYDVDRLVGTRR
jgi:hypothetical protein